MPNNKGGVHFYLSFLRSQKAYKTWQKASFKANFRRFDNQLYPCLLMNKKIISFAILAVIIAVSFVPVNQQKIFIIKSSFLNVYSSLDKPLKWEEWVPYLRNAAENDSTKISIDSHKRHFKIRYDALNLDVKSAGNIFDIVQRFNGQKSVYTLVVLPAGRMDTTQVIVTRRTTAISYIAGLLQPPAFEETHIPDLKKYMETDSLRYGCNIFKTKVPDGDLIETGESVPKTQAFATAASLLASLRQYMAQQKVTSEQPLLAQFLPRGKDSVRVNIGFFINQKIKPSATVKFAQMPKGAPLYAAYYTGAFNQKQKIYKDIHQYFIDRRLQSPVLPFEMYMDNKLPVSDTSRVHIRINFTSYF